MRPSADGNFPVEGDQPFPPSGEEAYLEELRTVLEERRRAHSTSLLNWMGHPDAIMGGL